MRGPTRETVTSAFSTGGSSGGSAFLRPDAEGAGFCVEARLRLVVEVASEVRPLLLSAGALCSPVLLSAGLTLRVLLWRAVVELRTGETERVLAFSAPVPLLRLAFSAGVAALVLLLRGEVTPFVLVLREGERGCVGAGGGTGGALNGRLCRSRRMVRCVVKSQVKVAWQAGIEG